MTGWQASSECGIETVTYSNLPSYAIIGDAQMCTSHGNEGKALVDGSPFGKMCPKCGLIQYVKDCPTGAVKAPKYNGRRCTDCNHVLVDEQEYDYHYCARCGRGYNCTIAPKTRKKCPHCGGNTVIY